MSTTAKVFTFIVVGTIILAISGIGGAIICVFATPLERSNPLPGWGGGLAGILEHLIKYGLKGGAIGAVIGGLTWAIWGYFWFRKKTDEATAITNCNATQPSNHADPQDAQ